MRTNLISTVGNFDFRKTQTKGQANKIMKISYEVSDVFELGTQMFFGGLAGMILAVILTVVVVAL